MGNPLKIHFVNQFDCNANVYFGCQRWETRSSIEGGSGINFSRRIAVIALISASFVRGLFVVAH